MILKESYLTNLIKESIRETLNERTKSEKNLSDDEVSYRRDMKFADSIEDDYEDSIYDDEQEKHNDKLHKRRIKHHKATQNHKKKNIEENLKKYIKESVKKILKENFNADTITFILNSPMNGQLNVQVPYDEFMNSKNKIDLLWKYCEQQNDVQLMNNGYFKVHPNDPHKNEIENNWR